MLKTLLKAIFIIIEKFLLNQLFNFKNKKMKKKLLKAGFGLALFTFALGVNKTNAQIISAYENFDYTVGTAFTGQNGGAGWAGPWTGGGGSNAQVVAGNLTGSVGATADVRGSWGAASFRSIVKTFDPGDVLWVRFAMQNTSPNSGTGLTFHGSPEMAYFGDTGNGGIFGTGSANLNEDGTGGPGDVRALGVNTGDLHTYLIKMTGTPTPNTVRLDVWVDYLGTTPPLVDTDPTFGYTCYRNATYNFIRVRINSDNGAFFDGLRLSSTYFAPDDYLLPLSLTSLNAKSTAGGNSVTWSYTSNDKVASISVLRKDKSGEFVSIATLGANATSFTDANPLEGTNYYKLSSKDTDGSVTNYDLVASAKGFDIQPTFFPNPATGGVVNVVAGSGTVKSVSIFDLSGRKVASKVGAGAVNTSSLVKGVYIIEIAGENASTRSKLVVE